jgi:hypothetical protein
MAPGLEGEDVIGSEIPHIPSMRPEPDRDRWGRYKLPDPGTGETRSWTRATTLSHSISDTHGLTEWKKRMVLTGAAINPVLLRDVKGLAAIVDQATDWREARGAKEALTQLADDAADAAGANRGSKLGTLLHTITEYADAGRLGEIEALIPTELYDDLAAYLARMADAGISCPTQYIERILVNSTVDSAGTTDRILLMPTPCRKCGLDERIGDLKTQKSLDFGFLEIAIQLAEYANADAMWDDELGELVPMPPVCKCFGIVMHLPVGSGECKLYELDLEKGWAYARLAHRVRSARADSKQIGWPYSYVSTTAARVREATAKVAAAPPAARQITARVSSVSINGRDVTPYVTAVEVAPANDETRRIFHLIDSAGHPKALAGLWEDLSARGLWTDDMTQRAAARKAALLAEMGDAA